MSLKDIIIKNNIKNYKDIKKYNLIKEYNEFLIKIDGFKYIHKPHCVIEYIKRNMNIKCKCGSGRDLSWHQNAYNYYDKCYICSRPDNKDKIIESRKREKKYSEEIFSVDETINMLNTIDYTLFFGSGKIRTFIKQYNKLYSSIMINTKELNHTKNINLKGRIKYILSNKKIKISCECLSNSIYDNNLNEFKKFCNKCTPPFNSIKYFNEHFGEKGNEEYEKNKIKMSKNTKGKILTLDWFKNKYGEDIGASKYNEYYIKLFNNRKNKSYSKISQKLFWLLLEKIKDKENVCFEELNKEKHINLNIDDKKMYGDDKKVRLNLDFVYKNKIIEFNGEYWHSSQISREIDIKRKEICENKGYDVLFVWENDFNKNQEEVINRCLRFLNDDIKINDRFMIKTLNGYEAFDNIISKGEMKTLLFKTKNNHIEVSFKHKFVINNKEAIAETLKVGDYLETTNGFEPIISIEEQPEREVFDILNTSSHTFIANNINNHNCSFLGSSHTLISSEKLAIMKDAQPEEIRDSKLKIYKYPEKNRKYVLTVDPAKDGKDAFAVQVIDITDFTFEQVASAQLQIDYLLMPEYINDWAIFYNNAYLVIENNEGAGQSIADQMYRDYEYENLHFDKDSATGKRKKYPGFRTGTKSRKLILQTMKLFIENDKLIVQDKSTINEFLSFILHNNKFQADDGMHDDMIMALALAFVPFCNCKNFDDMKKLVKHLYIQDDDTSSFTEHMVIGSFDDYSEVNEQKNSTYTWNGFLVETSESYF